MGRIHDGIGASPGIVMGPAHVLLWELPRVPHTSIDAGDVADEIQRFHDARTWAQDRIREIQRHTERRLGMVEAQIFEPQVLMLDDAELVDGTVEYIRDNHLSAARAFELRMLEIQSAWSRSGHPMIMDRLNDLSDIQLRVIRRLLDLSDPDTDLSSIEEPVILVARDLTPTITVQLDRNRILGLATDAGTRTSHSAILARSLGLPAVVSLGELATGVASGDDLILDGREGRVIVNPTADERRVYRERDIKVREWEQELMLLAHLDAITPDQQPVLLRANIDLPSEASVARSHGGRGIGLYRTEFFVVGRSAPPEEEEQYRCYREVLDVFPDDAVYIRTFDLGGDKFPAFLHMPPEENPFLGWRAIRVCLDTPDMFRTQLRALLRATAHGDVRIMLPLVSDISEIRRTRQMIDEEAYGLEQRGVPFNAGYKLGVMIETPAAALTAAELARYADFFSIGTNDLVQYTLAVDRGNSRLAGLYNPFHPSVIRLMEQTARAGRAAGIEVSVCGEMAGNPLGVFLLLGLGINAISVAPSSLPEVKKVVRSVPAGEAREAVTRALRAPTGDDVIAILVAELSRWLDLSLFSGRWNLPRADKGTAAG
ncbi:MAG TPA: phosphoenolpyruvate--protein phosphotransferase [Longimicrobiales bacterium]|nr:phosphoenolpyruvate--protein phosphotransferase [Longimicrobiales bacterium]